MGFRKRAGELSLLFKPFSDIGGSLGERNQTAGISKEEARVRQRVRPPDRRALKSHQPQKVTEKETSYRWKEDILKGIHQHRDILPVIPGLFKTQRYSGVHVPCA